MEGFEFQFVDATFLIALAMVGYKIYGTSKKMFGNTTALRVIEEVEEVAQEESSPSTKTPPAEQQNQKNEKE